MKTVLFYNTINQTQIISKTKAYGSKKSWIEPSKKSDNTLTALNQTNEAVEAEIESARLNDNADDAYLDYDENISKDKPDLEKEELESNINN